MKYRLVTVVMAGVLLAGVAGLTACNSEKQTVTAPAPEVVHNVALFDVQRTAVPDRMEAVGTVRAAESAPLAAQIMGSVIAVNVREGDTVKRGQVLVVIDDTQIRAALDRARAAVSRAENETAAAESGYTLATTTLKRYQNLLDKKAVSPQEFDEVKARMQAASARLDMAHSGRSEAKAALAEATTMLGYTRIRAPFDGVVTEKRVDPGMMATPGMPLLTVEKTGRFRLEATVDESSLRSVKLNEAVAVRVDSVSDKPLTGKVVQIVPAADPASRSFIVKVELPPDAQLRSGLFGRAFFVRGQRESLLIPRSAVVDRGQLQGVYVVGADQTSALRYISLGQSDGDQVEVLSGLQPGDRVVASPGTRDFAGKRIQ